MALLRLRNLAVTFGGVQAVDDVSFDVPEGDIVGLMGPNGAGKTTLLDAICGFVAADGSARMEDAELLGRYPYERAEAGIGRTFQTPALYPSLTTEENLLVAFHSVTVGGVVSSALGLGRRRERKALEEARMLLDQFGLAQFRTQTARRLSYGTLRMLELACVFARRPRLLLMDEPSVGMAQKETEELGPLLTDIRDRLGAAVLIVEHDMPLLMSISDAVVAMDRGRVIATGTPAQVQRDDIVAESYFGRSKGAADVGS